jgi:hypothetical protein
MINWSRFNSVSLSLGVTAILVVATVLIFRGCGTPKQTEADKLPPAVVKTMDSLAHEQPAFVHRQDSLVKVVVFDTARAVAYRKAEERAKMAAASAERRADSLGRVATSANEWHAAYEARSSQADTLKMALARADSVAEAERSARRTLALAYGADTTRRVAVEKLNADLREAIRSLEKPCRIIGPIPCPSRTASAGLGLLAGAVAGRAVK